MSKRASFLICVMAALLMLSGCATGAAAGEDLGGGFRLLTTADTGDHLYFRGSDLGRVGFVSVAPSGSHAIFERNGDLFLIASATGNLRPVTEGGFSMPNRVAWNEEEGFADVVYVDDHPVSTIELK